MQQRRGWVGQRGGYKSSKLAQNLFVLVLILDITGIKVVYRFCEEFSINLKTGCPFIQLRGMARRAMKSWKGEKGGTKVPKND